MSEPQIEILGVYKVTFTSEFFEEAMEIKYGDLELSDKEKREAEDAVRKELSSVVLIEVLIDNVSQDFDVGDFGQKHMDQVAYDEAYLSLDGTQILSRFDKPAGDKYRIGFFLHYYEPDKPLETPFGQMQCPLTKEMPQRLLELMPYEPVD